MTPAAAEGTPRMDWIRVSRGCLWLGFGIFFLLTTLDGLPRGFWLEACTYWPVLLIGLGLRLIFERSRLPALVLLSPALILGTLGWITWTWEYTDNLNWHPVRAEITGEVEEWTLTGNTGLAKLAIGSRDLPEGLLAEGRISSRGTPEVRISDRGSSSRVFIEGGTWSGGHISIIPYRGGDRWEMDVTRDLPISLALNAGFVTGRIEIPDVEVRRAEIDGAFNSLTLRLGPPPESGARISLEGAFNDFEVIVPRDTPVRISSDGFVNITSGRKRARGLSGPGYRVWVNGAFNRVKVKSD